jgi:hypothetical protein
MHAYIVRRLLGQEDRARALAAEHLKSRAMLTWPRLLGRCLAGEESIESLLRFATNRLRKCEIFYYAGMRRHLEGNREEARRLMQECIRVGVTHYVEPVFSANYLSGRWAIGQ